MINLRKSDSLLDACIPKFVTIDFTEHLRVFPSGPLIYQNIKISPSFMVLENAFEGKSFSKKLKIQNLGTNAAFIRICPASSYAIKIKPLISGMKLCPGFSIKRTIKYTYMRATSVPLTILPIYINEELVDYKIMVSLSKLSITAVPDEIDFGAIDAGNSTTTRTLTLYNNGSKGSRFAIDLGRNCIELVVEPTKGIIEPYGLVTFRIECLSTQEGPFSREFWIKCEIPIRVPVTGKIINPTFQSFHPNSTEDFTLVDFPKTYYGTSCIKTLEIKNYSSTPAVYCTLAEINDETMDISEACTLIPDYLNFKITPSEGTLNPYEDRIFSFKYTPRKMVRKKNCKPKPYSFVCIRIMRIPCTTLGQIDNVPVPTVNRVSRAESLSPNVECISLQTRMFSTEAIDKESSVLNFQDENYLQNNAMVSLSKCVRVLLFGEAETPKMSIRPNYMCLDEIPTNKPTIRELLLINESQHLPIIFKYKKVCFVKVNPEKAVLSPSAKLEIEVSVTPTKIGKMSTKIAFDLLFHNQPNEDGNVIIGSTEIPLSFEVRSVTTSSKPKFNMGITPAYVKEVGFQVDDVRFNTNIDMPQATLMPQIKKTIEKHDDDLIAFPNDRPKSIRPWKSTVKCRTICAGIARTVSDQPDKYELTKSQLEFKKNSDSYYLNFIRLKREKMVAQEPSLLDIDVPTNANLLLKPLPKIKCLPSTKGSEEEPHEFIPLTPSQLSKVKVSPTHIQLGRMASSTEQECKIVVHNYNNFPILIYAKSRRGTITFPKMNSKTINALENVEVEFEYTAPAMTGYYVTYLDLIVNCSDIFTTTIIVDVTHKMVNIVDQEIVFYSSRNFQEYINVWNPLNVPVQIAWKLPASCFKIEPASATVPPHCRITCLVSYKLHYTAPMSIDAILYTEHKRRNNINLTVISEVPRIKFKSKKIQFDKIPLNLRIRGETCLENDDSFAATFLILNSKPINGLKLTPVSGIISGYGEQIINVDIQISACISFTCIVQVEIQQMKMIELEIVGDVVYPNVSFTPDILRLKKIAPYAYDKHVFVVANNSSASTTIDFLMEDYEEYMILATDYVDNTFKRIQKLELEAEEQRTLYLHFYPMGAALYRFILPIIINDILGPATLDDTVKQTPSFFINPHESNYEGVKKLIIKSVPKKMPVLTVVTSVTREMIAFSKMKLNFKYFSSSKYPLKTQMGLKIWNHSKDTYKFCVRTDQLKKPFSLAYLTGNEVEKLEKAIVCTLAPNEEVTFKATFNPLQPGNYFIQLPIYLDNYLDGAMFNYLTLTGYYPRATISIAEENILFEPVPLKCEIVQFMYLKMDFHQQHCKIFSRSNSPQLRVQINIVSKETTSIPVSLRYYTTSSATFYYAVDFYCTCRASCTVNIKGCSDNCLLTTHAFLSLHTQRLYKNPKRYPSEPTFKESNSYIIMEKENVNTETSLSSVVFVFDDTITNFNETGFPLFPDEDNHSEYAIHMRNTLAVVEEWVSHQGFYGSKYYKIPDEISIPSKILIVTDKAQQSGENYLVLKYVELLVNLVGPAARNYMPSHKLSNDNIDLVNDIYNIYHKALDFVQEQGGFLPHVSPEHLLTYRDYIIYVKDVFPRKEERTPPVQLSQDVFYRISKQCWLDLLLQTYKVLVLKRIKLPDSFKSDNAEELFVETSTNTTLDSSNKNEFHISTSTSFSTIDETGFWQSFSDAILSNSFFSTSECILLQWLEYHFNMWMNEEWTPDNVYYVGEKPYKKTIKYFDYDLHDSLALIAVTGAYCPYLKTTLTEMYMKPTCMEQAFHNACNLVKNWSRIGLSYNVTPYQIVNPNPVQMLMLVAYLYEVLPTFRPNNSFLLQTGLSSVCTQEIEISNHGDSVVFYNIDLIGNDNNLFSLSTKQISVSKQGKFKLPITFHAKQLERDCTTLILNGEVRGKCYAKSMAFNLIGEPILSYCTSTVTIPCPLYKILELNVSIKSPYESSADYDINYAFAEPNDATNLKILPHDMTKRNKIPKRLMSFDTQLIVNDDGIGIFAVCVFGLTTRTRTDWIVFSNANVGAFTVKFITIPKQTQVPESEVKVVVPESLSKSHCICKIAPNGEFVLNNKCPRAISIAIPSSNGLVWDVTLKLMTKLVNESDVQFWKKYLGTSTGLQVLKWIIDQESIRGIVFSIQDLFEKTVTYDLTLESHASRIFLPSTTTIENVHCSDRHYIMVHVNNDRGLPRSLKFKMTSVNGIEVRYYNVHFFVKL